MLIDKVSFHSGCFVLLFMIAAVSKTARGLSTMSRTKNTIILHWFRHGDLRLHDNPALVHSCQTLAQEKKKSSDNVHVIPFFCFDNKVYGNQATSPFGSLKCGPRRAKFVAEAVQDLQQNLVQKQSGLLVSHGQAPHEFVAKLVKDIATVLDDEKHQQTQWMVVCQEELLKEERDAVNAIKSILPPKASIRSHWGSTMYELADLPFDEDLGNLPDTFTPFRNKVEKKCEISLPLATPTKELKELFPREGPISKAVAPYLDAKAFPTLQDLGYSEEQVTEANTDDPRGVMKFTGGETAALARVQDYIWTKDRLGVYFDTRNGMLGADYSTKFSPWLAFGCVSPRLIAKECRRYEQERVQNKSTYWVVFELLWRDYCKFFCYKHGDQVFFPNGITSGQKKWKTYDKTLEAWKEGKTGYPLIDANMRELKATGFMSNRGRQNVASFLALDLQQDWRYGADYFECHLLDYDVYSNWYNWCAAAGMTGGRINRFNTIKQSKDYDQHGEYVRHWCPELEKVPNEFVHEPFKMNAFQQRECGISLGVDYPHRIQTAAPPGGPRDGRGDNRGNNNKRNGGRGRGGNDRKRNPNNRHQKYEMKSLKESEINMKARK